jgi:putative transposase
MKILLLLLAHLLTTVARYLGTGSANAVIAENPLLKQQLLVINRAWRRAPNLTALDRFLFGLWSLFIRPRRLSKVAVVIRPSTLLKFHEALKEHKYQLLFSPRIKGKPGPKGPSKELNLLIVEMNLRNQRFRCPRIAQQISKAFGIEIDKDVVRRVLAKHYRPEAGGSGPSWLTFIGHMKDSLWS